MVCIKNRLRDDGRRKAEIACLEHFFMFGVAFGPELSP
jgi:hypothetical protein